MCLALCVCRIPALLMSQHGFACHSILCSRKCFRGFHGGAAYLLPRGPHLCDNVMCVLWFGLPSGM
jgi:hypothetical protein